MKYSITYAKHTQSLCHDDVLQTQHSNINCFNHSHMVRVLEG